MNSLSLLWFLVPPGSKDTEGKKRSVKTAGMDKHERRPQQEKARERGMNYTYYY